MLIGGFVFTCTNYPLEIAFEGFGKVFFHSQLSERLTTLHSGPLITELSVNCNYFLVNLKLLIILQFLLFPFGTSCNSFFGTFPVKIRKKRKESLFYKSSQSNATDFLREMFHYQIVTFRFSLENE